MKYILLIVVSAAFATAGAIYGLPTGTRSSSSSNIYKAWLDHEKHDDPSEAPHIDRLGRGFVMGERWKNYQKGLQYCPAIGEVIRIEVDKTVDGGDYVVTLHGIQEHDLPIKQARAEGVLRTGVCSFWLSGNSVRDISPY